jgi:HrpA-like RNA helicase
MHSLPPMAIMAHEPQLLELVDGHRICGVSAATATGKTRFLPFMLFAQRQWTVRVAIPTTVAVRDAYRFVSERCGTAQCKVGFAAARVSRYSSHDDIVYATTGHFASLLISMLKCDASRAEVKAVLGDVLMVDEVHLMSKDTTMLLGLLVEIWPELAKTSAFIKSATGAKRGGGNNNNNNNNGNDKNSGNNKPADTTPPPRILFSSATFDRTHLCDVFGEFPVLQLPSVHFPIDDFYLSHTPAARDVDDIIVRIIRGELEKWQAEIDPAKRGHVLVFRPGQIEVESTMFVLSQAFPVDGNGNGPVVIYPAFSYLAPEEIDEIFLPSPDRLKVVVSTNIAESSITIADIAAVVDDCWEKQAETSTTGGYRLSLVRVSQQAAVQRRGRTGRTMPGRCYRLCTATDFNKFQFDRTREIDRVPIFNEVLKLFDANVDPRRVLQISDNRLNQALLVLLDLKMCTLAGKDIAAVTAEGRFVAQLQLGVFNAHLIFVAYQRFFEATENVTDASLIADEKLIFRSALALAALLESYGPSYFFIPRREAAEALPVYEERRRLHVLEFHSELFGATDVHTLIALFWAEMTMAADARSKDKDVAFMLRDWSTRHCINHKKMREALALDQYLVRHFREQLPAALVDFHRATCTHHFPGDKPEVPRQPTTFGDLIGAAMKKAEEKDKPKELGVEQIGDALATVFAIAHARNLMTHRRGSIAKSPIYVSEVFDNIPHRLSQHDQMSVEPSSPHKSIVVANITQLSTQAGVMNLCSIFVPGRFLPAAHRINFHAVSDLQAAFGDNDDDDDDDDHDGAGDDARGAGDQSILRAVNKMLKDQARPQLSRSAVARASDKKEQEKLESMSRALAALSLKTDQPRSRRNRDAFRPAAAAAAAAAAPAPSFSFGTAAAVPNPMSPARSPTVPFQFGAKFPPQN